MDVRRLSRDLELLEAMVEGADDGLWILDGAGRVLEGNRQAETLSGLARDAARGRQIADLAEHGGLDWSVATDALARRTPVSQVQTRPPNRKLLVSAKPIAGAGGTWYLVLSLRDVTDVASLVTRLQDTRQLSDHYRREAGRAATREAFADRVVARSDAMQAVWDLALRYAAVDSPVLLLGETGTGKGVFSRVIHEASGRSAGPFIEVNCGAIPDGLVEAELFGYARGAFTGASARGKLGLVELAHTGTLLLNEVGDLPVGLQAKLLRFLEDGEVWPVGGVRGRRPDVRILAATNRDLPALMARDAFRRDLYYRLAVLTLTIPPLRARPDDVPWLVAMMLADLQPRLQRRVRLSPAALGLLGHYAFPGNVRELWNLVERLAVCARTELVEVADLPAEVLERGGQPEVVAGAASGTAGTPALRRALDTIEAQMLRDALARFGTQTLAAAHLGVSQATIARRAKRYGFTPRRASGDGPAENPGR
jgi:PAS domain S-box-containing protein